MFNGKKREEEKKKRGGNDIIDCLVVHGPRRACVPLWTWSDTTHPHIKDRKRLSL